MSFKSFDLYKSHTRCVTKSKTSHQLMKSSITFAAEPINDILSLQVN